MENISKMIEDIENPPTNMSVEDIEKFEEMLTDIRKKAQEIHEKAVIGVEKTEKKKASTSLTYGAPQQAAYQPLEATDKDALQKQVATLKAQLADEKKRTSQAQLMLD